MVNICTVKNCNNTSKDVPMHCFPVDPELFKIWIMAIQREDITIARRKSFNVCDVHFAHEMKFITNRNKTNLKRKAFPTLHLPGGNSSTMNEDFETPIASSNNMEFDTNELMQEGQCRQAAVTPPRTPKQRKDLNQRIDLLKCSSSTRKIQLSPKARKYYTVAKSMIRIGKRLKCENASIKKRLLEAKKVMESAEFFTDRVNKRTLNFIQSQLLLQKKQSRGRRFSIDDKIFALSLLKQSPRGYRLLQKTFALPSRKTLTTLLNEVPFGSGLNRQILEALRCSVSKMDAADKFCCIIFDEMSLEPSLTYNPKLDCIVGFEDCGDGLKAKFADHAMVFMARGLHKKWKQPIAYYFAENGMSAAAIVRNLKIIISKLHDIGLTVVATICDQHSTNSSAINMLLADTNRRILQSRGENQYEGFLIGDKEVIPLYDAPHLLKGVRNNLMQNDVQFVWKNNVQTASWRHIIQLYELDVGDSDMKMLYKLTDSHVYKDKLKKMKVKHAAQVFSHRVSSTMRGLVKYGNNCLPPTSTDTADFLLFIDKLFDSVNNSTIKAEYGKPLRGAVTATSPHVKFWYEAISVLTQTSISKEAGKQYIPPTIKNWIITLRGLIYIWRKLKGVGFEFLCVRNLNQDPVENFFGCIRSHGVRNINPTAAAFVNSFKTLIVSNFVSSHSPGANCEEDESEGSLNCLRDFLSHQEQQSQDSDFVLTATKEDNFIFHEESSLVETNHSYLAGYLARKILMQLKGCKTCRSDLVTSVTQPQHSLIKARAYTAKCLLKPHTTFTKLFSISSQILHYYLPLLCNSSNLKKK